MNTKQHWVLTHTVTLNEHKFFTIEGLRIKCEAIVLEGIADMYKLFYYQDNELEDTCEISDYFNVDNFQSN